MHSLTNSLTYTHLQKLTQKLKQLLTHIVKQILTHLLKHTYTHTDIHNFTDILIKTHLTTIRQKKQADLHTHLKN